MAAGTVEKTVGVYPKQGLIVHSQKLYRAFVGGIGSGKSHVGALDILIQGSSNPGRLYLVTAPTYPALSDATFRSVVNLGRELEVVAPIDVKSGAPPSLKMINGAEILFRSTENYEMLRGSNLSGIWMDEASLSKREAFDILIGRLREGGKQGRLLATFTPKGKAHWTYKMFGCGDPDVELVRASSSENPFLPPGFVENVRKRYTARQAQQEIEGAFLDGGGNHYFPESWPRYSDFGDAYRIRDGDRWRHIRKAECSRLLALDWAMGKPKSDARSRAARDSGVGDELGGDHTAFVVADMSEDGLLFLLWCLCERIPIAGNAPRLAEACRRWRPVVVAGDDDNLSETMVLETRRYRDIPSTKPMAIGGRNKIVRSQAMIVRAERGRVLLPEYVPSGAGGPTWVEVLSDQLESFTGADGEPDDIADAASILGRLADEFVPGEDPALSGAEMPMAVGEAFAGFGGESPPGTGYSGHGLY